MAKNLNGTRKAVCRPLMLTLILTLMLILVTVGVSALDTVIGEAGLMLNGEREHVRTQETNLGNLVTDVIRQRSGADIALYNGGGIRTSANMGEITLENAMDILAFQNDVVKLRMTGADIRAMLEHGVSSFPEVSGKFLQVSGMRYHFNPANAVGNRIVQVFIGGEPIRADREYTVATNEFLAAGGDDYTMLADAPQIETYDVHDQAMFIQHLQQQDGPVFPTVEGRIVIER